MGKPKHRYSQGNTSIVNEHEERRKMKESILKIFHQRAMSPDGAVLVNEMSTTESYSKRKPATKVLVNEMSTRGSYSKRKPSTKDVHHDKAVGHHEKFADVTLSSESDAKSIPEIKNRKRCRNNVAQENAPDKGFANAVSAGAHISRNRLTRKVGLFNTGKKSKTVYRDFLTLPASVQKDVDRTMKKLVAKDDIDCNAWSPEGRPEQLDLDAEPEPVSRPGRLHMDAELEPVSRPGRLHMDAELEPVSRPGRLHVDAELEPVSRPVVSRVKPASTNIGPRSKGGKPVNSLSDSATNTDGQCTSEKPSSSDPDVFPKTMPFGEIANNLLSYMDSQYKTLFGGRGILSETCSELKKLLLENYMTPEGKLPAGAGGVKSRGGSSVRRSLLQSLAQSATIQKDCTGPGLCQSRPHSTEIVPSHKPVQTSRFHKRTLSFDTLFRPASPPASYYSFSKSSFDSSQIGLPGDSGARRSETRPGLKCQDRKLPGALQYHIRRFPGRSQQCDDDRAGAEDRDAIYACTTVPSRRSTTAAVCPEQGSVSAGSSDGRRATSEYRNHCCNPTSRCGGKAGLGDRLRATSACRSHCCNAGSVGGNAVSAGLNDAPSAATSACRGHLCNPGSHGGKAVSFRSPDPAALCRLSTMFECSAGTGPRDPMVTVKRNNSDIKLDVQFLEFEKSAIDLLHRSQFMDRLSSVCGEEESQAPARNIPVYAAHSQTTTHSTAPARSIPVYAAHGQATTHSTAPARNIPVYAAHGQATTHSTAPARSIPVYAAHGQATTHSTAPARNIPVYAAHSQATNLSSSRYAPLSGLLRGDNEHTRHCLPAPVSSVQPVIQGSQNLDFDQWLPVSAAPLSSHQAMDLLDHLDLFTEPEATQYPGADSYTHTQYPGGDGYVHAHCDFPYLDGYSETDELHRSYPGSHLSQSPVSLLYNSPQVDEQSDDASRCQWQQGLDSLVSFLPALRKPSLDTPSPPRKMSPHLLL